MRLHRAALLLPLLVAPAAVQACSSDDSSSNATSTLDGSAPEVLSPPPPGDGAAPGDLTKIQHVVVIYLENHSFDNLYGQADGVDGLSQADASASTQIDEAGAPYATLPVPLLADGGPDPRFPTNLANAPFAIDDYVPADAATSDLHHIFFTEQNQINGGAMNRYALWSDARGLSMGYYRTAGLPLAALAKDYTICDRFFHAAFGGSFLNHQWLIAARTPELTFVPDAGIDDPATLAYGKNEGPYWHDPSDDKWYAVNTAFSVNGPHPFFAVTTPLVPSQTYDTIGDRLTAANLDWAWYSGGWDDAVAFSDDAGTPDGGTTPSVEKFQYHHQPFVYFAKYAEGQPGRAHLKDEKDFIAAAKAGTLPAVSFVKPVGISNEHPGYTDLYEGEVHVKDLVDTIRNGPNWKDTAIVITYDEHGGFWDHVAPPNGDKWGPGSRVPTIVISPFAKKGFVDHTVYDTTSILATIEKRWGLSPLTARDGAAKDLSASFDFTK